MEENKDRIKQLLFYYETKTDENGRNTTTPFQIKVIPENGEPHRGVLKPNQMIETLKAYAKQICEDRGVNIDVEELSPTECLNIAETAEGFVPVDMIDPDSIRKGDSIYNRALSEYQKSQTVVSKPKINWFSRLLQSTQKRTIAIISAGTVTLGTLAGCAYFKQKDKKEEQPDTTSTSIIEEVPEVEPKIRYYTTDDYRNLSYEELLKLEREELDEEKRADIIDLILNNTKEANEKSKQLIKTTDRGTFGRTFAQTAQLYMLLNDLDSSAMYQLFKQGSLDKSEYSLMEIETVQSNYLKTYNWLVTLNVRSMSPSGIADLFDEDHQLDKQLFVKYENAWLNFQNAKSIEVYQRCVDQFVTMYKADFLGTRTVSSQISPATAHMITSFMTYIGDATINTSFKFPTDIIEAIDNKSLCTVVNQSIESKLSILQNSILGQEQLTDINSKINLLNAKINGEVIGSIEEIHADIPYEFLAQEAVKLTGEIELKIEEEAMIQVNPEENIPSGYTNGYINSDTTKDNISSSSTAQGNTTSKIEENTGLKEKIIEEVEYNDLTSSQQDEVDDLKIFKDLKLLYSSNNVYERGKDTIYTDDSLREDIITDAREAAKEGEDRPEIEYYESEFNSLKKDFKRELNRDIESAKDNCHTKRQEKTIDEYFSKSRIESIVSDYEDGLVDGVEICIYEGWNNGLKVKEDMEKRQQEIEEAKKNNNSSSSEDQVDEKEETSSSSQPENDENVHYDDGKQEGVYFDEDTPPDYTPETKIKFIDPTATATSTTPGLRQRATQMAIYEAVEALDSRVDVDVALKQLADSIKIKTL